MNFLNNKIIYHIYLPSFVKNIQELITKLDYIKSLNVDYIWVNPLYKSGGKDCGYDVVDYYSIDNKYGNMDDLRKLFNECHKRNIKVLFDLILNHTSIKHKWFEKSIQKIEPYNSFYIWRNETEKNNDFTSLFDDNAWTYNEDRGQYYYHFFYKEQPDLNLENDVVINELKKIIKFWVDYGVDGFRMDAISCLIPNEKTGQQLNTDETHELLKSLTDWARKNVKNDILFLGETEFEEIEEAKKFYNSIDLVMNYQHAYINELSLDKFYNETIKWNFVSKSMKKNPLFFFYNHDRPRQRYGESNEQTARLMAALLLINYGTKIIYYGQEINMKEGPNLNIDTMGRDGCRTPMQWSDTYTNIENWIPIQEDHKDNNVLVHEENPNTLLKWYRYLTQFQKDIIDIKYWRKSDRNLLFLVVTKQNNMKVQIIMNFSNQIQYCNLNKNVLIRSYSNEKNINVINPHEVIIFT